MTEWCITSYNQVCISCPSYDLRSLERFLGCVCTSEKVGKFGEVSGYVAV